MECKRCLGWREIEKQSRNDGRKREKSREERKMEGRREGEQVE